MKQPSLSGFPGKETQTLRRIRKRLMRKTLRTGSQTTLNLELPQVMDDFQGIFGQGRSFKYIQDLGNGLWDWRASTVGRKFTVHVAKVG